MRLHGDREPRQAKVGTTGGASCRSGADNEVWSYGPEVFQICKKYMQLREELRSYTRKLMEEAHEKGTPVMRTLFFEFPDDPMCWEIEEQYMYGDQYLCCPVLSERQTQTVVYLPKLADGKRWQRLWSKEAYEGGTRMTVASPLHEIPVFIKS
jgi:alpha-D-xyloside xylohydrolase